MRVVDTEELDSASVVVDLLNTPQRVRMIWNQSKVTCLDLQDRIARDCEGVLLISLCV